MRVCFLLDSLSSFIGTSRLAAAHQPFHSPPYNNTLNLSRRGRFIATMTASATTEVTNGAARPQRVGKAKVEKKEVKILMLHGYTQSGPLFHAKTRALEKLLVKTLAPISISPVLIYPTGPNRLLASDIPGYQPPEKNSNGADEEEEELLDAWCWYRKDDATGEYRLLNTGMATIADAIREAGGIDAVCGFSQGGAMAGFVAAALEPTRPIPQGPHGEWVRVLRDANAGQPVKFAISYSGFLAPVDSLKWCYDPVITTPTLHYIGSLDTVVDESRSQALIDHCQDPLVVVHPGGHHVPVSKEWAMPLAGFIRQHAQREEPRAGL